MKSNSDQNEIDSLRVNQLIRDEPLDIWVPWVPEVLRVPRVIFEGGVGQIQKIYRACKAFIFIMIL